MNWIIVAGLVGLTAYGSYRWSYQAGKRKGSIGGFKAGIRRARQLRRRFYRRARRR